MSERYEYTRLKGSGCIRVIHLEPGSGDDIITCTLEPIMLGQGVEYEALSYAWGDANDRRTIKCHGKDLEITYSLFTGLRQLRRADQSRILWADAICINQQDVEEKGEQVQLMSLIYSQPQRILIWLGENTEGLEGVHESLETVLRMVPPVHFDAETIRECSLQFCHNTARLNEEGRSHETLSNHDWRPINALLDKPWFSRKWIVQEVSMAPGHIPRILMCGPIEVAWETLSTIGYAMSTYGLYLQAIGQSLLYEAGPFPDYHFSSNSIQPTISLVNTYLVKLVQHFTSGNLLDCAMATFQFKCTDSRDHIYSLLGLARRGPNPITIHPEYSKTTDKVLFDFARSVLVQDQNANLLGVAPNTEMELMEDDERRVKMPSWVPDLAYGAPAISLVGFTIRKALFQAGMRSGGPAGYVKPIYEDKGDNRLHVQGRVVDVVMALAPCPFFINVPNDDGCFINDDENPNLHSRRRRTKIWFDECLRIAFSSHASGPDGGSHICATHLWDQQPDEAKRRFARTMMMDQCGFRDPLQEDTVDAMVDYVDHVCKYFDKDYHMSEENYTRLMAHGGMVEWGVLGVTSCRFCITKEGRFGQMRTSAREGDLVCVVVGCQVPLVIRPIGNDEGTYELIGDSYVSEIMHGEAMVNARYETVEIVLE